MSLQKDLSDGNVIAYANACKDVADSLCIHTAYERRTVVIPSRGAFPVYKTADHMREYETGVSHEHEWDIIPFTFDDCQQETSAAVREHWVKVLLAESSGVRNDEWDFYQKGLAKIGKQRSENPRGYGKFVMIDTAISGRAAVEILESMERHGLDYHLILLADQGGDGIKQEYKTELNKFASRVQQVNVANLYTEDRGPALMGITTVLMPDLLPESRLMSTWDFPREKIGNDRANDKGLKMCEGIASVNDFFASLHGMHFHASKLALKVRYGDDHRDMQIFRDRLLSHLELTTREATTSAFSFLKQYGDVEATGSMAVRVRQHG